MSIEVNNSSKNKIRVAINSWGTMSDTTYYTIGVNETKKWSRSDSRGFVMYIVESIVNDGPYYVLADSNITVYDNWVKGAQKITNLPSLQQSIELSIANMSTLIEE